MGKFAYGVAYFTRPSVRVIESLRKLRAARATSPSEVAADQVAEIASVNIGKVRIKVAVSIEPITEYDKYLQSEHWWNFARKIRKARGKCERCSIEPEEAFKKYRQRLNVHHLTYERIGNEKPEDVVLLCWACHMKEHGNVDWVKFCASKSMPEARIVGYLTCANCKKGSSIPYWNHGEGDEWLCEDCR